MNQNASTPDGVAIANPHPEDTGSQVLTPAHLRGGSSSRPPPPTKTSAKHSITIELDQKSFEAFNTNVVSKLGKRLDGSSLSPEEAAAELIGQFLTTDAQAALEWLAAKRKTAGTNLPPPKGETIFAALAIAARDQVLTEYAEDLRLAEGVRGFVQHAAAERPR